MCIKQAAMRLNEQSESDAAATKTSFYYSIMLFCLDCTASSSCAFGSLGHMTAGHVGIMPWAHSFCDPCQSDVRTAMDHMKD